VRRMLVETNEANQREYRRHRETEIAIARSSDDLVVGRFQKLHRSPSAHRLAKALCLALAAASLSVQGLKTQGDGGPDSDRGLLLLHHNKHGEGRQALTFGDDRR